jgi:hypothetical protein
MSPSAWRSRVYCSRDCAARASQAHVPTAKRCEWCKQAFARPEGIKTQSWLSRRFCSNACKYAYRRTKPNPRRKRGEPMQPQTRRMLELLYAASQAQEIPALDVSADKLNIGAVNSLVRRGLARHIDDLGLVRITLRGIATCREATS